MEIVREGGDLNTSRLFLYAEFLRHGAERCYEKISMAFAMLSSNSCVCIYALFEPPPIRQLKQCNAYRPSFKHPTTQQSYISVYIDVLYILTSIKYP